MLLSQVHRLRALDLLGKFLDLGPWAVNLVSVCTCEVCECVHAWLCTHVNVCWCYNFFQYNSCHFNCGCVVYVMCMCGCVHVWICVAVMLLLYFSVIIMIVVILTLCVCVCVFNSVRVCLCVCALLLLYFILTTRTYVIFRRCQWEYFHMCWNCCKVLPKSCVLCWCFFGPRSWLLTVWVAPLRYPWLDGGDEDGGDDEDGFRRHE